jgi:protein-S-isoprenylcysteine O-methyltransferase Ste14
VILATASVWLIGCTMGVHRAPVSLWHQEHDQPHVLVTSGPYAVVRHPFYCAFTMMLLASVAAFPHAATVVLLACAMFQLNRTAAREERRLLTSALGAEYDAYMRRTGRFLPRGRVSRRRAPSRNRQARPATTPRAS